MSSALAWPVRAALSGAAPKLGEAAQADTWVQTSVHGTNAALSWAGA